MAATTKKVMRIRFGYALRQIREGKGETLTEYAATTGIARWILQAVEGVNFPSAQEVSPEHYLTILTRLPEILKHLDKDPPAKPAGNASHLFKKPAADDVGAQILAKLETLGANLDYLGDRVAKLEAEGAS